jgi:hypothetical protein
MTDLHDVPTPKGWKISIMLEELGLPCAVVPINILRHSGMVRRARPQMRNCASGNLEIPGSMLSHRPGMTE